MGGATGATGARLGRCAGQLAAADVAGGGPRNPEEVMGSATGAPVARLGRVQGDR